MSETQQLPPLVRAKLHRPSIPRDLVNRGRLCELLDTALTRPVTLVSAPAGYGKSTLISHWIDSRESRCAWVSLDDTDGDLGTFLDYLLAAVRKSFPDVGRETESLSRGAEPSVELLAGTLANELDELDSPFVLVLDDYHRVKTSSEVHELLRRLLHRPPRTLHLVIATRIDPPLPLTTLRARGQLLEVRLEDLRFTPVETTDLLARAGRDRLSDAAHANLESQFEGWAAGLRLAILALRHAEDPDSFLESLHGGVAAVQDYLMQEVLTAQSDEMRAWMLKSSILDRFSPALCEAVCRLPGTSSGRALRGEAFVEALCDLNLFCISLDSRNEWFRFHHQFQMLLQTELARRSSREERAELHSRARDWLAGNDSVEEAILHALAAKDEASAADLVEQHRMSVLDEDRWYTLEKWLSLLPENKKKRRPALLLSRAWILIYRQALANLPTLLDEVDAHLTSDPEHVALSGEVDYFRGHFELFGGNGPGSLALLESALEKTPIELHQIYGEVEFSLALARQMCGEETRARRELESLLADLDSLHPIRQTRVVAALAFLHFIADDLTSARVVSELLQRVAEKANSPYALAFSHYLQGAVHFLRSELLEASAHLQGAVQMRHDLHRQVAADAMGALARVQEARGLSAEADATRELMVEYARQYSDATVMQLAECCQQRLTISRGDLPPGTPRGAEDSPAEAMVWWLEVPALTHCRRLLAQGSEPDLEEAERRLRGHLDTNEEQHNTRQLIEILPLLAVVLEKRGRTPEALSLVERALALAAPGGSVRAFLELGEPMASLLHRLPKAVAGGPLIRRILSRLEGARAGSRTVPGTIRPGLAASPDSPLAIEALTDRELEILELLAERFQNKEIAGRLFISTHTVNDHLKGVYQKLNVHGRRQAVARARELGLLGAR